MLRAVETRLLTMTNADGWPSAPTAGFQFVRIAARLAAGNRFASLIRRQSIPNERLELLGVLIYKPHQFFCFSGEMQIFSSYDHYSILRTIEDNFGLGPIHKDSGDGAASVITGIWK